MFLLIQTFPPQPGLLDHEIFTILWGPCVASLVYVCDKTDLEDELKRILRGFRSCASIAAHFILSDVFDNIVISLTKCIFKSLSKEESFILGFANSHKAQLATHGVFELTRSYGDMLRAGWKNMIEMMLCFFVQRLLPEEMMETHDFVHGRIKLIRDSVTKPQRESSILNALYSYLSDNSNTASPAEQSEESARFKVIEVVNSCNVPQLVSDSKFLVPESLAELIRALLAAIRGDDESNDATHFVQQALHATPDQVSAFCSEVLLRVLIENRDRVATVWPVVSVYFEEVLLTNKAHTKSVTQGRVIVSVMRLAIRLLVKEELVDLVLQSLCLLLRMPLVVLYTHSRQVANALFELVQTNHTSIRHERHWSVIFSLLEFSGAAVRPNLTCVDAGLCEYDACRGIERKSACEMGDVWSCGNLSGVVY